VLSPEDSSAKSAERDLFALRRVNPPYARRHSLCLKSLLIQDQQKTVNEPKTRKRQRN
jgi:hypothetical protein